MRLKGKTALVTGAARGIGEGIAVKFAQEGARVVLNDLNSDDCHKVLDHIKTFSQESFVYQCDISDSTAIENMINSAINAFGTIDILVNNAGLASISPLEATSEQTWDRIMSVDLKGVFLCSTQVMKTMMKNNGGSIINIASNSAQAPIAMGGPYPVAKAGVRMLTRLMALEWGKYHIRTNSISPGFIRTPLTESAYADPENARKRAQIVPLKRIGTPEDIANVALFLASEESSYIIGEDIVVDGGFLHTTYEQAPNKPKVN